MLFQTLRFSLHFEVAPRRKTLLVLAFALETGGATTRFHGMLDRFGRRVSTVSLAECRAIDDSNETSQIPRKS